MAANTTIIASWSEIDKARQCPHAHDLAYKQRWQSPTTGPALSRGILWHEIMEAHYNWIRDWQMNIAPNLDKRAVLQVTDDALTNYIERMGWEAWVHDHPVGSDLWATVRPFMYDANGEQTEDQSLMEWMYEGHLRYWGLNQEWRILAVEHAAEYPLYNANGNRTRFRIKTKIDLIVERTIRGIPRRWLVDHKSGKNLPSDKELDLDDQFPLYINCLHHHGRAIFGTIHNAARTQRNKDDSLDAQPLDTRFKQTPLAYTPTQLDMVAQEALATLRHVYSYADGEAPRHPNSDTCRWRCDFTEPCLASRKGMDEHEFLTIKGYRVNKERH